MNDKFLFGMIIGILGGAVLATNSVKARKIIKDGQKEVKERVDNFGKCCQDQCGEGQ